MKLFFETSVDELRDLLEAFWFGELSSLDVVLYLTEYLTKRVTAGFFKSWPVDATVIAPKHSTTSLPRA